MAKKKMTAADLLKGSTGAMPGKIEKGVTEKREDIAVTQFKMRYFDIPTNTPLSIEKITQRIAGNFKKIGKLSVEIIADLFFIYIGWESFYSRTDSFKEFLETNIPVDRVYAYSIIRGVNLLISYYEAKTNDIIVDDLKKMCNSGITHFKPEEKVELENKIIEVIKPVEEIGVTKLDAINRLPQKKQKYDVLSQLLEGKKVSREDIFKMKNNEVLSLPDNKEQEVKKFIKSKNRFIKNLPTGSTEIYKEIEGMALELLEYNTYGRFTHLKQEGSGDDLVKFCQSIDDQLREFTDSKTFGKKRRFSKVKIKDEYGQETIKHLKHRLIELIPYLDSHLED